MKVTTDSCVFGAWAAKQIKQLEEKPGKVLDIGCGTGLLSLMIAQINKTTIDAVEIEENAFQQANENISNSPWHDLIQTHHADILNFQPEVKYDCIITNPPFYENELKLDKDGRTHNHVKCGVDSQVKEHIRVGEPVSGLALELNR